ncbi:AMP-dependent synthetase [Pandoraea terrae]|uniref:AMP-dependent synthetase n=1 Tax=Pandoraea terrae TaxID=1537710 RepID=A0A5E4Z9N9_9BURK|nr:AMP-dependent synthetase [Pandoraea terrae]
MWLAPNLSISYREGAQRINRLASSFLQHGKQRDRVAIVSSNRFEALECYFAALTAGMAATPLNPKLHIDEISFMIADSGASFFVFSPEFADVASELRRRHPTVGQWICMEPLPEFSYYGDFLTNAGDSVPTPQIEPDDVAWLFYTSGTTGKPKGVMETHRNLIAMVQSHRLGLLRDINEFDRMIHFAPIAHATTSIGLAYISVGAAQVFPGLTRFDPPQVFDAIQRFGATGSFMAPTMVQMLLQYPEIARYDLRSVKNIVCGGAPMYAEVLRQAIDVFGPVFSQGFGQSEAPAQAAMHKSMYDLTTEKGIKRVSSVGHEVPGAYLRIIDEEGNEVDCNTAGEITVRGDVVTPGYWNRPEATNEVLKGGWLHTGDVGYRDEDGYIFITDRVKDMIISGGSNIYPREVEEVLLQHEAIAEACAVGVPDVVWGESVKAVVVLRPGVSLTEDEVIEFCRTRLATYKKPKSVDFVTELPKNAYGKVLKKDIKARYWQGMSRTI